MRISVIIPCHNAGQWIGKALASVAAQTLAAHEIIVIDDASTDDSVAQVQKSGLGVQLVRVQVRNAGVARNVGMARAGGDWIAFLDADDTWYPHHLAEASTLLAGGTDVGYMANFHLIDEQEVITETPIAAPLAHTCTGLRHREMLPFMLKCCLFGHSTVLVNRERALAVGGFEATQKRRHDTDLWLRILRDHTWAFGARPAAVYRVDTPGSISRNQSECEYYFLRALLRNEAGFHGPEMDQLIQTSARRGMSLSFMEANPPLFQRVRQQAWPYLSWKLRLAYRAGGLLPGVLRTAISVKRTLRNKWLRNQSHSGSPIPARMAVEG